jgi:AcrR family transcriptional regulator
MTVAEHMLRLDRRAPSRGDRRRIALLEALDHFLQHQSLDAINIADVSRRAGVTRSGFYFYFESKAHAVAALMGETYAEVSEAGDPLLHGEESVPWRIETGLRSIFDVLRHHEHVYRAMLEARATNETVRELWDAYRASFVTPVAELIRAEREAGAAPDGPDPAVLASVLLDLNDRAIERQLTDSGLAKDEHLEAVLQIWLRTIYGSAEPVTTRGKTR